MAFFETEFPRCVSFKAIGGPSFNTTVNQGFGGAEQRNRNWSLTRAMYQVSLVTPPKAQFAGTPQEFIDLIRSFYLVVGGKADAFRFYDHIDHGVKGQQLGVGDGTNKVFQLVRDYTIGGRTYTRTITKPITSVILDYQGNPLPNTFRLYFGSTQITDIDFTTAIDATTGFLTIPGGHDAPGDGVIVSADFDYHIPVRFDSDQFQFEIEESDAKNGNAIVTAGTSGGQIPLIEVRL